MSDSHDELVEQALCRLNALFSRQRRAFSAQRMQHEVSLPQLHVLIALQEEGPMTVSALAQVFRISAPSASSIVDRLEERGLVCRSRDATDRRVVHVEVSDYGRRVTEELSGVKREHVHRLLAGMTDDELRDVVGGLEAVLGAMSRLQAKEGEPEPSTPA